MAHRLSSIQKPTVDWKFPPKPHCFVCSLIARRDRSGGSEGALGVHSNMRVFLVTRLTRHCRLVAVLVLTQLICPVGLFDLLR